MVLSDLRIGQCARILRVNGGGELRRRLLDMGLTPNTIVKLVRVAPLGDPIELCLRGYNLSLREEAARDIEVELLSDEMGTCGQPCRFRGFGDCDDYTAFGVSLPPDATYPLCVASQKACDEKRIPSEPSQDNQFKRVRRRRRWQRNR